MVDVQLEAAIFRQLSILRRFGNLVFEKRNLVELRKQHLLLPHLFNSHILEDRHFQGAKAANVRDVNVKQTLESEAVSHLGVLKVIVVQNFGQALAQRLEHAFGDVDSELVFEELEHLWAIKCLLLRSCVEVLFLCELADVAKNNGSSVVVDPVICMQVDLLFLVVLGVLLYSLLLSSLTLSSVGFLSLNLGVDFQLATDELREHVELVAGLFDLRRVLLDLILWFIENCGDLWELGLTLFFVIVSLNDGLEALDSPTIEPRVDSSIA